MSWNRSKAKSFTVELNLVTKILPHCDDEDVRFGFILTRFAGLRIPSEIRLMRLRDFDNPEFFKIHWDTKTDSRSFPLQKIIRESIERLRVGKRPDDFVFPERFNYRYKYESPASCVVVCNLPLVGRG